MLAVLLPLVPLLAWQPAVRPDRRSLMQDMLRPQPGVRVVDDLAVAPVPGDWLVRPVARRSELLVREDRGADAADLVLTNGLVARRFRVAANLGCVSFRRLENGAEFVRAARPEALVTLNGRPYEVGGLGGQPDQGYLDEAWIPRLTANPEAFRFVGYRVSEPRAPLPWKPRYGAPDVAWPPKGVRVALKFAPPPGAPQVTVRVVYELYDGMPLLAKWVEMTAGPGAAVEVDRLTCEQLAVARDQAPRLFVESDFTFYQMVTTRWEVDPLHVTSAARNFEEQLIGPALLHLPNQALDNLWDANLAQTLSGGGDNRTLLSSRYPAGPAKRLEAGETFTSFRTYEIAHDSDDRERQGLARRRMYRALAPWTQENPIFMHLRASDSESIRRAVDQCAAAGFEMVILTFWSGFDMNNEDPAYIARLKADFDYAHSKGIKIGGYVLFCSTASYGKDSDAVQTVYPPSLCLGSAYSDGYFARLLRFIDATGMDIIETDGPYHGYPCAATEHKFHRGLADSYRVAWERQRWFFGECRRRGVFINAPDWYFLSGSSKTGMGYREENWSLPRELQILIARQNVYDGTWEKTPSMGWMFVPLVEYHGGGAAATLEPLSEHLDAYEAHLAQNFGAGVIACYRGPRLYDTDGTREVVSRWAGFFRRHRDILCSDIVHIRRPDGRDLDAILHVNPALKERALAMVYNPLDRPVTRELAFPLYYAGLSGKVRVREQDGRGREARTDAGGVLRRTVSVPAHGRTWLVFE